MNESFVNPVVMRGLRTFQDIPPVIVALELWHAWRTSRQLCHWYRLTKRAESELSGCSLYIQIMRRRSALSLEAANNLVNQAEESYCEWPRKRPLRYRDLVSYIVMLSSKRHTGLVSLEVYVFEKDVALL
jgi:hypothetical protein